MSQAHDNTTGNNNNNNNNEATSLSPTTPPPLVWAIGTTNKAKVACVRAVVNQCFPNGTRSPVPGGGDSEDGGAEGDDDDKKNSSIINTGDNSNNTLIPTPVDSIVAAQPLSDAETLRGAEHRARAALAAVPQAHFGVGLEGGIQRVVAVNNHNSTTATTTTTTTPPTTSTTTTTTPPTTTTTTSATAGAAAAATPHWFEGGWMCVVERATNKVGYGASAKYELPPKMMRLLLGDDAYETDQKRAAKGYYDYSEDDDDDDDNHDDEDKAKRDDEARDKKGKQSHPTRTTTTRITALRELGDVMDAVTGGHDVRSHQGAMGILTAGHLPRAPAYAHGLVFAFAPFLSEAAGYWD